MEPTYIIKKVQLSLLVHKKNTILIFRVILECINIHLIIEKITLQKCVNNDTSAQVAASAGIF